MSDQVQTTEQSAVVSNNTTKKPRKPRSDKGKKRGPRKPKAATTEG